jgi:hypothetical protein
MRMKITQLLKFTVLFLLIASPCLALEQYSAVDESLILEEELAPPRARSFLIEANLMVHSIASSGNTMFGPGFVYGFSESDLIGVRTLFSPFSGGSFSAGVLYRREFSATNTRFFLEPSVSYHLISDRRYLGSAGLSVGLIHDLTPTLAIGGSAGLEGYNANAAVAGSLRVGQVQLSPKSSIQLSVYF